MCLFKHFDSLRATMSLAVYAAVRCVSARAQIRATAVLLCTCAAVCVLPGASSFAQTCPTEDPAIDSAKSHKLFLYFPTTADASFPSFPNFPSVPNVTPAQPFDIAALSSGIGTTAQLIDEIRKVVADDYCEFNVQVLATTTNPATLANPPPRRATVAIGSDINDSSLELWGQAQEVDVGDVIDIDFARVWAGTYTVCEGGLGPTFATGGCSTTGALSGSNATLQRWGQAIGGSAAHEAGHTYGLAHSDDDPPIDPCKPSQAGPPPTLGEDAFNKHLMPAGCNLTGPDRAGYRRHFSNRGYGILAKNVGLSIATMHNWELLNPNAEQGVGLAIDFLSQLPSISIAWTYSGAQSPWLTPTVSSALGTAMFKDVTYNKFRITWSAGNPAWNNPSPGIVGGGAVFHVGTTFTGVDFNQPDPIIIQDVTLLDASSQPLPLHPRLPSYDAGTLLKDQFVLNFFAPENAPAMRMVNATVFQLPQLASIDSLVSEGRPFTRNGRAIRPWASTKCASGPLRKGINCAIAGLDQKPHVEVTYPIGQLGVYACRQGIPIQAPDNKVPARGARDSALGGDADDLRGPICAGTQRDPFPAAVVYVVATFMDPNARHFDQRKKKYVVGPVISKVYYQFAGVRHLPERRPNSDQR